MTAADIWQLGKSYCSDTPNFSNQVKTSKSCKEKCLGKFRHVTTLLGNRLIPCEGNITQKSICSTFPLFNTRDYSAATQVILHISILVNQS